MLIRLRPALAGLSLSLAAVAAAVPAHAQDRGALTVERIFGGDFRMESLPAVQWMRDGQRFTFVQATAAGATDIVAEDARIGTRTVLVQGARLVPQGATQPIEVEDYAFSRDERKVLLYTNSQRVWRTNTKGTYYVWDLDAGRLTPASTRPGWQMFAKLSPDARKVGFVRDHDLYVTDLATGAETRLTSDGGEAVINGTFDWLYEEELDLQDGWRWSEDGSRIAFWRIEQGNVPHVYLLNETAGQYQRLDSLRYPKAGAPNPTARVGVVSAAGGAVTWLRTGDDPSVYLARMEWIPGNRGVMVQRLNRHQNQLDVLVADPATGESRVVFTDRDSAWVEVDNDFEFVRGGAEMLFTSERGGHNQIFAVSLADGRARPVTDGAWDVTELYGLDERGGWVYFAGAGQGPRERHVYRVRLSGGPAQRLSTAAGTHRATWTPGSAYYIDVLSRAGVAPVTSLHSTDGRHVRTLVRNERAQANLSALSVALPEWLEVPAADGTPLSAMVFKPANFDASRKYPVLMYVYGGPGSQTVTDAWGGSRYLWHQLLAQKGYVVVSVDNRGTAARGSAFKKSVYLNLGRHETADQISAANWLAKQPWVDGQRLGIWGWSYGGYMASLTMMRPGSPFKAGIAVAPVAAWDLYDTAYTERFMRTPQENPRGYADNAPTKLAAQLKGDLLVVHGTGDDNVHFQNALQLAEALQEAGKPFDFMAYPNRTHSISGARTSVHLFTMMTRWIEENL